MRDSLGSTRPYGKPSTPGQSPMPREPDPNLLREYQRVGVDRRRAMQLYSAQLLERAPADFRARLKASGGPFLVIVADDIAMRTLATLPDQAGTERFVEALVNESK